MDLQCLPEERRHGTDLQTAREVRKGKNRQPESRTERGIENGRRGHHPAGVPLGQRGPDSDFALVGRVRWQAFRQPEAEPAENEAGAEAEVHSCTAEHRQPASGDFKKHPGRNWGIAPARCIQAPGRAEAQTGEWAGVHSAAPELRQAGPGGSSKRRSRGGAIFPTEGSGATGRTQAGTDERAWTHSPTTESRKADPQAIRRRHGRRNAISTA